MAIPVQIAFPDFPPSDAVAARIRHRVSKLEQIYARILDCYVSIGYSTKRHHKGNLYYATVEIHLPNNKSLVYSRSRDSANQAHANVYVAVRDAFNGIERQLRDVIPLRRRRLHSAAPQAGPEYGRIIRLIPESPSEGFGFLAKEDGQEVYFNSRSVRNEAFAELKVGSEVRFTREQGEQGPQASTVWLIAA